MDKISPGASVANTQYLLDKIYYYWKPKDSNYRGSINHWVKPYIESNSDAENWENFLERLFSWDDSFAEFWGKSRKHWDVRYGRTMRQS